MAKPKPNPDEPKRLTRAHKWVLLPLGFRVDAAYRAANPPPDRIRKCSVCGLSQIARPDSHGAHCNWPKSLKCTGPANPAK